MTRIVGFTDYLGPIGGFTSPGHYSGVATTSLSLIGTGNASLRSSGNLALGSDNGDIDVDASGHIFANAGTTMRLHSSGLLDIRSENNIAQITALDAVTLGAGNNINIGAGDSVIVSASQDIVNQAQGGIAYIIGDHGIVLATDQEGLAVPTDIGVGSISGLAAEELYLSSSGQTILRCENGPLDIISSGTITISSPKNTIDSTISIDDNISIDCFGDISINSINSSLSLDADAGIELNSNDIIATALQDVTSTALRDGTFESERQTYIYGDEGITLRTDAINKTGFISGIATEGIFISSSGNMKLHCENANMDITASGNITFGAIDNLQAGTFGGAMIVDKTGNYTGVWGGSYTNFSTSIVMTTTGGGAAIYGAAGSNMLRSSNGNVGIDSEKGQITLDAWASSGQLRYEFGPYEAWHTSPSHTSSFFPIPHSGQIVQMIAELGGGISTVIGTSGVGATTAGSTVTISGINQYCSIANVAATANVISLGSTGATYFNIPAFDTIIRRDPIFQGLNPITVLRTGFYEVGYNFNFDNSGSSDRTVAQTRMHNTTTGIEPSGTQAHAYLRLSTVGEGTASLPPVLVYASAGDVLQAQVRKTVGLGNVDLLPNSHITMKFIGDWDQ
jgi:hypothetical protein